MKSVSESILADARKMEFYNARPVHKAMLMAFHEYEQMGLDFAELEFFKYSAMKSRSTKGLMNKAA